MPAPSWRQRYLLLAQDGFCHAAFFSTLLGHCGEEALQPRGEQDQPCLVGQICAAHAGADLKQAFHLHLLQGGLEDILNKFAFALHFNQAVRRARPLLQILTQGSSGGLPPPPGHVETGEIPTPQPKQLPPADGHQRLRARTLSCFATARSRSSFDARPAASFSC